MTADPAPRPRRRLRRAVLATALALALTLGGTTAWALNRYVIAHVEIADVDAYEAAQAGSSSGSSSADSSDASDASDATVTATTYDSDDASISISTVVTGSGDDQVTYYVADVVLSDATVLRSAFADNQFGTNITQTTSEMAEDNDAVFAINGDYYGFRDTGIVIRNGVVYRDEGAREGLAFYTDGHVEVYDETATTADELLAAGVWNTLSFGPALVEDGEVVDGIEDVEVDTNVGNHSIQGDQPRTAVGVVDDNHLVFVVVDGRSPGYSAGVDMTGLAEIMQSLGAETAYNLDGGGSSTMYFDGSLVNDPLGRGAERGTSDILYVAG
ncbi:exopolysaccharide biosynthesis protein [Cellulomonas hominis]|uniref:Exopolysaccharide biosynthesis protein n=1 Tax=Cellulomonas hominis TaxID=156981 RepID=A0A511FHV8_9CELL|nr:phosphodiester glycosidase family protein [Cellulomonas hominis]MBB5474172.1 exopolysaccharide biosynthesis protein [Cellulomonas hominis]NKY08044.1 phosphodiester glycosidase family protein [Cellulomonas hominis]GEL48836.1 exopolysaccharide biosynthesis protein [Cellulomonas hominis]